MWVKFSDFTPVQVYGTYWMRTDAMPKESAHAVELYRNDDGDWLVKSPYFRSSKPKPDWLFWHEPLQPPHPATLPSEPLPVKRFYCTACGAFFTHRPTLAQCCSCVPTVRPLPLSLCRECGKAYDSFSLIGAQCREPHCKGTIVKADWLSPSDLKEIIMRHKDEPYASDGSDNDRFTVRTLGPDGATYAGDAPAEEPAPDEQKAPGDILAAIKEIYAKKEPHHCFCCPVGYEPLQRVLKDALARAAKGKGAERHATGEPFIDQPIFTIPRALGGSPDPLLYQAVKKIYESKRLDPAAARNELLDAIVYIAAAVILEGEDR